MRKLLAIAVLGALLLSTTAAPVAPSATDEGDGSEMLDTIEEIDSPERIDYPELLDAPERMDPLEVAQLPELSLESEDATPIKREAGPPLIYRGSGGGGYSQRPAQGQPSSSYGIPAQGYGLAPTIAQGPVVESLRNGQSGDPFNALTPDTPDMFYFSPKDQVLYRVSRVPIDGLNPNALAGLTGGGTGTGVTDAPASAAATEATATPAPNAAAASAAAQNSSSPGYAIEFEVEEETGGEYVGGFGAQENRSPNLTPAGSGGSAAPIASGAGAGSGGASGLGSSNSNNNNNALQQLLLNALRQPSSGFTNDLSNTDDSNEGVGGYSGGGYRSSRPSSLYGAPTNQVRQVVLPPQVRISPELAQYLTLLKAQQLSAGQRQRQSQRNTVIPSAALPENLDAATGTPGQAQRRVRKRMNFKAGGAIG